MMPTHPSEDENNTDESGSARDFMLKKDDHPGYIRSNQLKEDRQDLEIDQVTPDDLDKLYSHDVQPQQQIPQFPQVNSLAFQLQTLIRPTITTVRNVHTAQCILIPLQWYQNSLEIMKENGVTHPWLVKQSTSILYS